MAPKTRTRSGQGPQAILRLSFQDEPAASDFVAAISDWSIAYLNAAFAFEFANLSSLAEMRYYLEQEVPTATDVPEPRIHRAQINSPGWLELLANMNPLKVVSDMTKMVLDHRRKSRELSIKERESNHKMTIETITLIADIYAKWDEKKIPKNVQLAAVNKLLIEPHAKAMNHIYSGVVTGVEIDVQAPGDSTGNPLKLT